MDPLTPCFAHYADAMPCATQKRVLLGRVCSCHAQLHPRSLPSHFARRLNSASLCKPTKGWGHQGLSLEFGKLSFMFGPVHREPGNIHALTVSHVIQVANQRLVVCMCTSNVACAIFTAGLDRAPRQGWDRVRILEEGSWKILLWACSRQYASCRAATAFMQLLLHGVR